MKEKEKHNINFEWNIRKSVCFDCDDWLSACESEWRPKSECEQRKITRKIDMWQSIKMDLDNDKKFQSFLVETFPQHENFIRKKMNWSKEIGKYQRVFFYLMCFKF